jgi:LPXTG-site transpeptidase (sortase) family protein
MPTRKQKPSHKLSNSQLQLRHYLFFIGVGLFCAISGLLLVFSQFSYAQLSVKLNNHSPVRLIIPILRMNLPIIDSVMENNHWQISLTDVNHMATSGNPGENNNIVIYGHNKWEILGKLQNLEIGSQIDIKTLDGNIYTYVVFDKKEVNQYAVGYIKPTNIEMLTIFTCSGWFDSKRLIIQAKKS